MGGARENAVACMRYELCISRKRLLHSVFTRNASEREDVGEGVAAHVVCAVDAARDLARGVEAGDDAAVSVEHFGPRGDGNAAERAVDAHGDLGAVEGASGDAVHEDDGPAADGVVPRFDGFVVGLDGGDEGFGGDLKQGGEFGDGVRLEGVAAHEGAVEHGARERAHGRVAVGVENGEGDAAGLGEDGGGKLRARAVLSDEAFARAVDEDHALDGGGGADEAAVLRAAGEKLEEVHADGGRADVLERREHAAWVILAAAILIGMIWHSVAAERLVRRRSAELMETVKRQQASERQFEALERMTAVSQMSNIVAHELRQPLAAVTNFAMGVRRRIANGTLTADSLEFALGRILAENERASDIVEHVRDYARKRRRQITPVDLTQMSAKVVSSMRASNARVSFESEVPAGLFVEGDSLEIELVLRNLVKNAGESAAQADGVPRVVLAGERIGDEVVITVTDNGPVRTKAEIDAFLVPLRSEKSGGLGLGLAIVRRIIEAYGGTIVFDVVEPQGVRVEARLPARPDL